MIRTAAILILALLLASVGCQRPADGAGGADQKPVRSAQIPTTSNAAADPARSSTVEPAAVAPVAATAPVPAEAASAEDTPSVCDSVKLTQLLADEDARGDRLLRGFPDACTLSPELVALASFAANAPQDAAVRDERLAQLLADAEETAGKACPGFRGVFERIATAASDQRQATLVQSCNLARLGLGTREELSQKGIEVLIAGMFFVWLRDQNEPRALEIAQRLLADSADPRSDSSRASEATKESPSTAAREGNPPAVPSPSLGTVNGVTVQPAEAFYMWRPGADDLQLVISDTANTCDTMTEAAVCRNTTMVMMSLKHNTAANRDRPFGPGTYSLRAPDSSDLAVQDPRRAQLVALDALCQPNFADNTVRAKTGQVVIEAGVSGGDGILEGQFRSSVGPQGVRLAGSFRAAPRPITQEAGTKVACRKRTVAATRAAEIRG